MNVGILLCAISGGMTALAVSLAHDAGAVQAALSYVSGGMIAVLGFAAVVCGRPSSDRF